MRDIDNTDDNDSAGGEGTTGHKVRTSEVPEASDRPTIPFTGHCMTNDNLSRVVLHSVVKLHRRLLGTPDDGPQGSLIEHTEQWAGFLRRHGSVLMYCTDLSTEPGPNPISYCFMAPSKDRSDNDGELLHLYTFQQVPWIEDTRPRDTVWAETMKHVRKQGERQIAHRVNKIKRTQAYNNLVGSGWQQVAENENGDVEMRLEIPPAGNVCFQFCDV